MSIDSLPLKLVVTLSNESKDGNSPIYIIYATATPIIEDVQNISSMYFVLADTQKRVSLAYWKIEEAEAGLFNASFRVKARSHKWEAQVKCRYDYKGKSFASCLSVIIPAYN